ncbi:MAG: HAD-IC family P-type ATPase [Bifidobacteriaceae bacterium]|nr:HAD-IC family P-type ATPase [Bifidobacteriaceae bacterium]
MGTIGIIVIAVLLSIAVLWYFFGKRQGSKAEVSDGRQRITVTVQGGYSPAAIELQAGIPTTITFDRKETGECTSHVVFSDLGIDAHLPGNQRTNVEIPALPAGDYPFACGMNMVHGSVHVTDAADGNPADASARRNDAAQAASDSTPAASAPETSGKKADRGERTTHDAASDSNEAADEKSSEAADLKRRIAVGAVLTIPVFVIAMVMMAVDTGSWPMWLMNPWWQFVLITPVMFYCGWPIHRVGWLAMAHRSPEMNSLVTLGTFAAYIYSVVACIAPNALPEGSREPYFESVGVVITLVLVGRLLEAKAREGTGDAVSALIGLRPNTARKITDSDVASGVWKLPGTGVEAPIDSLRPGDLFVVAGGDRIPTDGTIVAGTTHIDESMVTGESKPVSRTVGDDVTGATTTLDAPVVVKATKVGDDTVLAQIIDMVSRAQATKAPVQQLADKIASIFVPVVILVSVWTFAIWFSVGPQPRLAHALVTAVCVLIIACPCALGLATPLSVTSGLGLGARNSVLVTSASALQRAKDITTVVFDKTGTITRGIARVRDGGAPTDDMPQLDYGDDPVKDGSAETIAALRAQGVRTIMLSGDTEETARKVADQVGIDTAICEVKPDGKAWWIERIQTEAENAGRPGLVAMIGDGINDAPALATADIGFAMGTGTDVAMQSADITLMSGDLSGVLTAMNLSRATMRNIRENLTFAFMYNIIGIPLAAGMLYPVTGWLLSPMIAGVAMALSSVCLVLNANRLRNARVAADLSNAMPQHSQSTVIVDSQETRSQKGTSMFHFGSAKKTESTFVDPVCGMTVGADSQTADYKGTTYHFCSTHCVDEFKKNPDQFINA